MPLPPKLRGIDGIRDYLFAGGYPDPVQNAEQLSFLIYFYMFQAADAPRVRAARRPGAKRYAGACAGEWTLRNPRNTREPGAETVPREALRCPDWANALNDQRLVSWVREEVFPFHAGIIARTRETLNTTKTNGQSCLDLSAFSDGPPSWTIA